MAEGASVVEITFFMGVKVYFGQSYQTLIKYP